MLQPIGPEIWFAEGPVASMYCFAFPTRMVVIRLTDGSLFVWSPVSATAELRAEIDKLGPVAHVVSPNFLHHLWMQEWVYHYPEARIYAPPGLRQRRPDLKFDADLGNVADRAWAQDVEQAAIYGSFVLTEIVFLHWASRTAIFGDLIQNFAPDQFSGWRAILARWGGVVRPNFGTPRDLRWTFLQRKLARKSLRPVLDFAPEQVIIAHGDIARENGTEFVRRGFRWLLE